MDGDRVEVLPDEDGTRVIVCRGAFDMDTLAPLTEATHAATADPTVRRIILDMAQVTFVDSYMLNLLVRAHRTGRLVLAGPLPEQVTQLLRLTGADAVFTICDNLPHARNLPLP
ncbi:hypothetical protein AMK16_25705 [Streptomyces sp. CB00455]|nr:hypothetical protein AMK16_25705 [Streptomyces sp. CB00455]